MENRFELKNDGKYKIELESNTNKIIVTEIESELELKTFDLIKYAEEYIENREKRILAGKLKRKEPLHALKEEYYGTNDYEEIKITSFVDAKNIWIVSKDKIRSKVWDSDKLVKNTEENKKKIEQLKELRKEVDKLKKSIEEYTSQELREYFKEE